MREYSIFLILLIGFSFMSGICVAQIVSPQYSEQSTEQSFRGGEKEHIKCTIPTSWSKQVNDKEGVVNFVTSQDSTKRLVGYIRSFPVPPAEQTAWRWAVDEAKVLESQGRQIVNQPTEVQKGNVKWVVLAWEMLVPSNKGTSLLFRNEQYYLKGKELMIEVLFASLKETFERVGRQEIDEFLSSVGFDTRSLEEAQKTTKADYIAELVTKEYTQPKKGDIIKGYLSVADGQNPPRVGDVIGNLDMPVYTSLRMLVNGEIVFAGLIPRDVDYKILKIERLGSEVIQGVGKGTIFEVQVEAVE